MSAPTGSIQLLVKIANHTATGGDLAAWATTALTEDFDSPSLRRLAALDAGAGHFEAMPLFERALAELALGLPASPEALRREYLRVIAWEIGSGARPAADALELIHSEVLGPLRHPEDLMPWCYLWEGLDPTTFAELDDEAVAQLARALALKFT